MKIAIISVCLSCIILLVSPSLVFAQVGIEQNRINVNIDSFALSQSYLPYGGTATLNATLNNTSPFLSGNVGVDVFPPSDLQSMVNVSTIGTLFFGVNQTRNITLTIQNVGTLSKTTNGTFSLQVINAGWVITDKASFQLSLGANPLFQNSSEPNALNNSTATVSITCISEATNLTLPGIIAAVTVPKTAITVSNTTNSTGQCTLIIGKYANVTATAKALDPLGKYLPASESIQLQSGLTNVTLYMVKPSNSNVAVIETIVTIVVVAAVSFFLLGLYKKKHKKQNVQESATPIIQLFRRRLY